jgi:hypothetical protein
MMSWRKIWPICDIKRILSLSFSSWNASKGGGDTITKLIDSIQERTGIRTDTISESARILQYFGVSLHRVYQWLTAKNDLDFYASLYHARQSNITSVLPLTTLYRLSDREVANKGRSVCE